MINYNGISEDKTTIFYSTNEDFISLRIEVYESSTDSFIFFSDITIYNFIDY